jgi:hypothetical protein
MERAGGLGSGDAVRPTASSRDSHGVAVSAEVDSPDLLQARASHHVQSKRRSRDKQFDPSADSRRAVDTMPCA